MTSNNLPPQAYTRETLAHAYEWLKSQQPAVREMATSADELVALYLQARRHRQGQTNGNSDAPVSAQKFKSELQNLAMGMKSFEEQLEPRNPAPTPAPPSDQQTYARPTPPTPQITESLKITQTGSFELDSRSRDILNQVQQRLNIGCEKEALRMLIVLGFEKVKEFLPKGDSTHY